MLSSCSCCGVSPTAGICHRGFVTKQVDWGDCVRITNRTIVLTKSGHPHKPTPISEFLKTFVITTHCYKWVYQYENMFAIPLWRWLAIGLCEHSLETRTQISVNAQRTSYITDYLIRFSDLRIFNFGELLVKPTHLFRLGSGENPNPFVNWSGIWTQNEAVEG